MQLANMTATPNGTLACAECGGRPGFHSDDLASIPVLLTSSGAGQILALYANGADAVATVTVSGRINSFQAT